MPLTRSHAWSRLAPRFPGWLGLAALWLTAVLPIVYSLVYAALYSVGLTGLLARGFTLEPWRRVLGRGETWGALGLSLWVAAATVALSAALGLLLALGLTRRMRSGPLATAVHLPLALPGTVAAFVVFQAASGGGVITRLAAAFGLADGPTPMLPLVHDPVGAGIVVAHLLSAAPFFALLFVGLHDSERLDELAGVARSLGAGPGAVVWRVKIPVLLHRAAPNLALLFVVVLGSFEIPLLLGRQAPQMISVVAWRRFAMFDIGQRPEAYAVALLFTAVVLALIVLLFRHHRGMDAG